MTSVRCFHLVLVSLLATLVLGAAETRLSNAQDKPTPESAPNEGPKFEQTEAQESFDAGKALFDKEDWKNAEKRFKACKKEANRDERKTVDSWIKACQGGKKLDKVHKAVAKQKWKGAWVELQKVSAKYGKTPLQEKLDVVRASIEKELFFPLATFEEDAPAPELAAGARNGAEFETKPDYVKSGKRSLRWSAQLRGLIGYLPLARFEPGLFQEYRYLHISIYSPNDEFGKFTLLFDTDDDPGQIGAGDPTRILQTRCFFQHLTINETGWHDLRIDLWKEIQTNSTPTKEEVQGLSLLIVPPSRPKTIYIDDIRLERK